MLAVFYEHPDWFRPLFLELERRGIPHIRIDASRFAFDPAAVPQYDTVFNRMSPSAWKRGHAGAIFQTRDFLSWIEAQDVEVINGSGAFAIETSKAHQLALLARLGIAAPRTRVVANPHALLEAAESLEFPIVVKPNIGGSGAGIVRFDRYLDLVAAVEADRIERGVDGVLLAQEYHRPRGNRIVRIETLGSRYLYGIRIDLGDTRDEFNLCPADICCVTTGGLSVEAFTPPDELIEAAERISRAADIDIGGIEYLESDRDGQTYFYDINALSNFVADPLRVIGFDPTARLVDALEARLLQRVV